MPELLLACKKYCYDNCRQSLFLGMVEGAGWAKLKNGPIKQKRGVFFAFAVIGHHGTQSWMAAII